MIEDRYVINEEFETKELNKKFWYIFIVFPSLIIFFWFMSYTSYGSYEIRDIYTYIYLYIKFSPILIILFLIIHKVKNSIFERMNPYIGILMLFSLISSVILMLFSTLFDLKGDNREFIIDFVFSISMLLFIIYFTIYYFRYMKRAKIGRDKYINELKKYHFIIDNESQNIEHNYFKIKNKKLEEKLDVLAIFIKVLTPTIITISVFVGYKYIQNGDNDPSIFITSFIGILGCAYLGSLISFLLVGAINLKQIEKQIGRKIYLGLYPETIARKKAEAKEDEEYWERRLEEEENKKLNRKKD